MPLDESFRKSSFSQTNGCLEARWHKATFSAAGDCVEVAFRPGYVAVRDSKSIGGPTVSFTQAAWALLLDDVAAGHFHWSRLAPLRFDAAERAAFEAGVLAGQFDLPAEDNANRPEPLYPRARRRPEARRPADGPASTGGA